MRGYRWAFTMRRASSAVSPWGSELSARQYPASAPAALEASTQCLAHVSVNQQPIVIARGRHFRWNPESGSITHGHLCGLAPQMLVAKVGFRYTQPDCLTCRVPLGPLRGKRKTHFGIAAQSAYGRYLGAKNENACRTRFSWRNENPCQCLLWCANHAGRAEL